MGQTCGINSQHEYETTTGTMKIFRDGTYTDERACSRCVEAIREDEITEYRIFVINGREVVLPREEIAV